MANPIVNPQPECSAGTCRSCIGRGGDRVATIAVNRKREYASDLRKRTNKASGSSAAGEITMFRIVILASNPSLLPAVYLAAVRAGMKNPCIFAITKRPMRRNRT
jgi:hypothetical protein